MADDDTNEELLYEVGAALALLRRNLRVTTVHAVRQPAQLDAGVHLVARVDGDQQSGQRLGGARVLEAPAVDTAQALDTFDQLGGLALVRPRVAAQEHGATLPR